MPVTWQISDQDREVLDRELADFVPPHVYDVHAHLWQARWWTDPPGHVRAAPPSVGVAQYREHMEWILPGRDGRALHFAYPFPIVSRAWTTSGWVHPRSAVRQRCWRRWRSSDQSACSTVRTSTSPTCGQQTSRLVIPSSGWTKSPVTLPEYAPTMTWPLIGIENLRAIKAAFRIAKLTDAQVEAFFHNNAARLLGA